MNQPHRFQTTSKDFLPRYNEWSIVLVSGSLNDCFHSIVLCATVDLAGAQHFTAVVIPGDIFIESSKRYDSTCEQVPKRYVLSEYEVWSIWI